MYEYVRRTFWQVSYVWENCTRVKVVRGLRSFQTRFSLFSAPSVLSVSLTQPLLLSASLLLCSFFFSFLCGYVSFSLSGLFNVVWKIMAIICYGLLVTLFNNRGIYGVPFFFYFFLLPRRLLTTFLPPLFMALKLNDHFSSLGGVWVHSSLIFPQQPSPPL